MQTTSVRSMGGQAVAGCAAATRAAARRCVVVRAAATSPFAEELKATAKYIATRGKGILASDESNATTGGCSGGAGTCLPPCFKPAASPCHYAVLLLCAGKRLESVGVENTEENRRDWRQLLYTAPGMAGGAPQGRQQTALRARDTCPAPPRPARRCLPCPARGCRPGPVHFGRHPF